MGTVTQLKPRQAPKVEPSRKGHKYTDVRSREHLTDAEMDRILKVVRADRNGKRNHLMILLAYRHGLRVSELINLRWDRIDLVECKIRVDRLKGSNSGDHPLQGDEIREIKAWQRRHGSGIYVFLSEQGAPLTRRGFHRVIANAGVKAGLSFPIHPHMLRHACGYHLVNKGYAGKGMDIHPLAEFLGHKNIQNTVRYSVLDTKKFIGAWD
jgi:integrase